jgi:hypothetical protein
MKKEMGHHFEKRVRRGGGAEMAAAGGGYG